MIVYCPYVQCRFSGTDVEVDEHRATGIHNDEPQAGSNLGQREDCPHDNVSWDPGNYLPPFGWEQPPGMFCDDCGEQMEEEDITEDIQWGDDGGVEDRYVLEEEARNPL